MKQFRYASGFFAIICWLTVQSPSQAFPWKHSTVLPYTPPYFGYFPTQWREFPSFVEEQPTLIPSTPVEILPEPKKKDGNPMEPLVIPKGKETPSDPKKMTMILPPVARGVAGPERVGPLLKRLPDPDAVPSLPRIPRATLGMPTGSAQ